jgi:hypothetical protein
VRVVRASGDLTFALEAAASTHLLPLLANSGWAKKYVTSQPR